MEEIEIEIHNVFVKQKYIDVFDKSGGLLAMQKNAENFTPILKDLTDSLISKSNKFFKNMKTYQKQKLKTL
jgi:hypothetical protein